MANLFIPFQVAVDGNGLAMSGAKLYFYQTGTNTPQDTWSSSSLTNPFLNSNPVVADSNGLWPPIYLGGALDYKAILKTSADVTVATRDPLLINLTPTATPPARSILAGLTLSAAGGTGTFGIAAGAAADSTNVSLLSLASAYTKTTAAWGLGSGNGALDTGAIANATWYSVYVIQRVDTGITDVLFSLSATSPTLPTNYTLFRRIGSMKTDGSAHWITFIQDGNFFWWVTAVADISSVNPGTAAVTRTLASVPTGLNMLALVQFVVVNSGSAGGVAAYLSDLATTDSTPSQTFTDLALVDNATGGVASAGARISVRTNTSAQVRSRINFSDASVTLIINILGWIDQRGQNT